MSTKTILVIDDSSTIRRLIDSTLSRAGYSVLLASNADDGLNLAVEMLPDMIVLDHQLPGTTGFEVCRALLDADSTKHLPVVISSTLRKRAYVEYADLPNVVDMLPKPYTEELLVTTVINALDTGTLVVASQEHGTAIPEVIEDLGESDLSGVFSSFTIREVIDFLNNGRKTGVLEVEAGRNRYWICLDNGRVQGITAAGVETTSIVDRLPETLRELAPVLKLTVRGSEELEGLVDLLDTKVLDPRLLRRLLRHQAAVLLSTCFRQNLKTFRFDWQRRFPPIYERLALDVSVLALLIEGAMTADDDELSQVTPETIFERQPIRGQNLDRAGLSAHQTRLLGRLTSPRTIRDLVQELHWEEREVRRVLHGLEQADLVAPNGEAGEVNNVIVFESDGAAAERLNESLRSSRDYDFQVVSDQLALQLLLKRKQVAAVVVDCSDEEFATTLRRECGDKASYWLCGCESLEGLFDASLEHPFTAPAIIAALKSVARDAQQSGPDDAVQPPDDSLLVQKRITALIESRNVKEAVLCQ